MNYAVQCSRSDYRSLLKLSIRMRVYAMNSIYLAGLHRRLTFTPVFPGMLVAPDMLLTPGRSLIALDDYGPAGSGPSGWPQANELIRWSQAVLLQCTRGFRGDYDWITAQTVEGKRTLLIETDLWHLSAWNQMLKDCRCKDCAVLVAIPTDSGAERVRSTLFSQRGQLR